MSKILLRDVMTEEVICCNENDTVDLASKLFEQHNIHHIPIVDQKNTMTGILSQTDIDKIKYGFSLFRNPDKDQHNESLFRSVRVSEIMTNDVISLTPEDSITDAYQILRDHHFRAIPILQDSKPVGIVTLLDMMRYILTKKLI